MCTVHCNHGRNHKALKLDVIIHVPRINRVVAPRSRNAVGISERIGVVQAEWVSGKERSERLAGGSREDPAQLPTAHDRAGASLVERHATPAADRKSTGSASPSRASRF